MRLLNTTTGEFSWVENPSQVRYATLSHVWYKDSRRETSYHDIIRLQDDVRAARARGELLPEDAVLSQASYKIRGACALARADGIDWLWVDTCCIDKASSAELEGAINAMYAWYRDSTVCYVFLQDVDAYEDPYLPDSGFRQSEWHGRGWTLQELIAPRVVLFFSRSWRFIGAKHGMAGLIANVTGVDKEVITGHRSVSDVSVARRMSWASRRVTTKREDEAYCLMGIFGVHMHVVYGEGSMAFLRLQEEILRRIPDETIFVWDRALYPRTPPHSSVHGTSFDDTCPALFASSPALFSASTDVLSITKARLSEALNVAVPPSVYTATAHGLRTALPLIHVQGDLFAAVLACQRNHRLLGLLLKKAPTFDVYSIGVLDSDSVLDHADGLSCMVQLPISQDGTIHPSVSPQPPVCVKNLSILHSSSVPLKSVASLGPSALRSDTVGFSERSVRCLASMGYHVSLSTPSAALAAFTLSSADRTRLASVELRCCGCPDIRGLEPAQPRFFAVRASATSPDALCQWSARGLSERCALGHGWHHLETSTPAAVQSSPSSQLQSSSSLSTYNIDTIQEPHKLSLRLRSLRGSGRCSHQLTLTLTCDYPGDDRYPARFTLSAEASLGEEGASTHTGESTSTLTCKDEWIPPTYSFVRLGGACDKDVNIPELLKNRDGDEDHRDHEDRMRTQRSKIEAISALRVNGWLRMLSRAPVQLWAAAKRGVVCHRGDGRCRTPSVYDAEPKHGGEASCQSVPRIVVYEASTVSTRPSSSTLPAGKTV